MTSFRRQLTSAHEWSEADLAHVQVDDFSHAVARFFDGGRREEMFAWWQVLESGAFPQGILHPAALELVDIALGHLADGVNPELADWLLEVVSFSVRSELHSGQLDGAARARAQRGFWMIAGLARSGGFQDVEGAHELLEMLDIELFGRLREVL